MRGLRLMVLPLALSSLALLAVSAQAGAASPQANKVKLTAHPIWTLAMDWPRVAYASGKEGNTVTIRIWNMVTGATSSAVKSKGGFATHHAAEIAIAGGRLAWVRTQQFGNTELDHWLYSASLGGRAHLIKRVLGYAYTGGSSCGSSGPQLGGLVGFGNLMAVSTWTGYPEGSTSSQERLSLITSKGLRTIATGPDAVVSESADGGHIAVLPLPTPSYVNPEYCVTTPPTSAAIYSTSGTLIQRVVLSPPGREIALSGKQLVVLTSEMSRSGTAATALSVYDWTTGALLHTWPIAVSWRGGGLAVYGHLASVQGRSRLHLVDLKTGKDVIAFAHASARVSPAIGPRGLVYAVNSGGRQPHGKLVFVPMSRLLRLVS